MVKVYWRQFIHLTYSLQKAITMTINIVEFIKHCQKIYPNQNPSYISTDDQEIPLDKIFVFSEMLGDKKYYHYISNGLAPYGFELSMRVGVVEKDSAIPQWPTQVMYRLANYVAKTGNVLQHGHHMTCNGSIAGNESKDSKLRNLLFSKDPQLEDFVDGAQRFYFFMKILIHLELFLYKQLDVQMMRLKQQIHGVQLEF